MDGPVIAERASVRTRWLLVAVVAPIVVVVDQLTKWWALQALDDRTIDLVWTLRLRLLFNTGSAFGLGSRFAPAHRPGGGGRRHRRAPGRSGP